jgi:hypothetical protein
MTSLASALGMRFMYTNQINDIRESVTLRHKNFEHDQLEGTINVSVFSLQQMDY